MTLVFLARDRSTTVEPPREVGRAEKGVGTKRTGV